MIENSILIGLSKQMALQRKIDVLANNMANVNTVGYKSDSVLFEEYLMPVARMTEMTGKDKILSYVNDTTMYRNYSEGPIKQTNEELDVAIKGDGWFVVQTPDGNKYTRNGHLKLNNEGRLVTTDGQMVLGEGGPITVGPDEHSIVISGDGTLSTNQGPKDQLRIVVFENNGKLEKEGDSLFSTEQVPTPARDFQIMQGMIENSNVQPVLQLTQLIQATREYVSMAQTLQQSQELRQSAIQQLGRPPQ